MNKDTPIGTNPDTHEPVFFPYDGRDTGVLLVGKTGMGKSSLALNLIEYDIKQSTSCIVVDPHEDLVNDVIAGLSEYHHIPIYLLDVMNEKATFGLNPYEPSDNSQHAKDRTVNNTVNLFGKVFSDDQTYHANIEMIVRATARLLVAGGYTMAELPFLFSEKKTGMGLRSECLRKIKYPQSSEMFWNHYDTLRAWEKARLVEPLIARVGKFLDTEWLYRVLSQKHTTIPFTQLFRDGGVMLLKLPREDAELVDLLGSTFLTVLSQRIWLQGNLPKEKRRRINLYIDEAGRFLTAGGTMQVFLKETRKLNLATHIALQFLTDVRNEVTREAVLNAGNQFILQTTGNDAGTLVKGLTVKPEPGEPRREEILTPVKDVVGHLKNRGSHTNPVVNEFFHTYSREPEAKKYLEDPRVNALLYRVQIEQGLRAALEEEDSIMCLILAYLRTIFGYSASPFRPDSPPICVYFRENEGEFLGVAEEEAKGLLFTNSTKILQTIYQYWRYKQPKEYTLSELFYEGYLGCCYDWAAIGRLLVAMSDFVAYLSEQVRYGELVRQKYLAMRYREVEHIFTTTVYELRLLPTLEAARDFVAYLQKCYPFFVVPPDFVEHLEPRKITYTSEELSEMGQEHILRAYPTPWPKGFYILPDNYARSWIRWDIVDRMIKEEAETFSLHFFDDVLDPFLHDLSQVLHALQQEPIMAGSGRYELKPGLPRPIADLQAELALKLATLPRYHAYYSLQTDSGIANEGIVKLSPPAPRRLNELKAALTANTIQLDMQREGIIRKWEEIQEELKDRQLPILQTVQTEPPPQEPGEPKTFPFLTRYGPLYPS